MAENAKSDAAPRLVVVEGKDKGKVINLADGTLVMGRSKGEVIIQDPRISRSHISFHFDSRSGKLNFTDLKSLNGTLLNGERADSGELKDGDKIQIGNTTIDVQLGVPESTGSITEQKPTEQKPKIALKLKPLQPEPEPAPSQLEKASPVTEPPSSSAPEPLSTTAPKPFIFSRTWHSVTPRTRLLLLVIVGGMFLFKFWNDGTPSAEIFEKQLAEARKFASERKWDEAIRLAQSLKKENPENSLPYYLLGDIYTERKNDELAIAMYEKAHILQPSEDLVHFKLIRVYLRTALVLEEEERRLQRNGLTVDATQRLRERERVTSLAKDEQAHIETLIQDEKKHTKALFVEAANLFLEFKQLQQPWEKIVILAKALQTQYAPNDAVGYRLEAQALLQENRPLEALAALDKGRAIDGTDEWLLEHSVFAKLALKDLSGAEKILDDWITVKPNATKPLLVYAYLRFNEKAYAKAFPYVQRILLLRNANVEDPYFPEALYLMAQIHEQLNQPNEALKFYQQACDAGFSASCGQALAKSQPPLPSSSSAESAPKGPEPASNGAETQSESKNTERSPNGETPTPSVEKTEIPAAPAP